MTYLDDVFIQDTTPDKMLQIFDKFDKNLKTEILEAALDKTICFLE